MAYSNGFPMVYPQYYPQSYQPQMSAAQASMQSAAPMPPQPQQMPQSTAITWVQGMEGARAYLVGAGNTVPLWDSEAPVIYLKSADAIGMPSMKILDYTVRDEARAQSREGNSEQYSTRSEVDQLRREVSSLRSRIEKMTEDKEDA